MLTVIFLWEKRLHYIRIDRSVLLHIDHIRSRNHPSRVSSRKNATIRVRGKMEGHCNCGVVTVVISPPKDLVKLSICHCLDCRASGGTLYVLLMMQHPRLSANIPWPDSQSTYSFRLRTLLSSKENLCRSIPPKQHQETKQLVISVGYVARMVHSFDLVDMTDRHTPLPDQPIPQSKKSQRSLSRKAACFEHQVLTWPSLARSNSGDVRKLGSGLTSLRTRSYNKWHQSFVQSKSTAEYFRLLQAFPGVEFHSQSCFGAQSAGPTSET